MTENSSSQNSKFDVPGVMTLVMGVMTKISSSQNSKFDVPGVMTLVMGVMTLATCENANFRKLLKNAPN